MFALLSALFITVSCDKDTEPWNLAPEVAIQVDQASITRTSANVTANVKKLIAPEDDPDGKNVQAWGIEYSENTSFSNDVQTHVIVRTNMNDVNFVLTGLTNNKVYYVRTFATSVPLTAKVVDSKNVANIDGRITAYNTAYSDYVTFTTLASGAPTFTELTYSNVTANSANLSATIVDNGGFDIIQCGYLYLPLAEGENITSLTPFTKNRAGVNATPVPCEGIILTPVAITDLLSSTRYAVCAFAVNTNNLTGYSDIKVFTTDRTQVPELAAIEVDEQQSQDVGTLFIRSSVINSGTSAVTERGFVYISGDVSTEPLVERTIGGAPIIVTEGNNAGFSTLLNNLEIGKKYYIRAYARNTAGVGYGSIYEHTVVGVPDAPTVQMVDAGVDSLVYAKFKAFIVNNGGAAVTAHGFVISKSDVAPEVGKADCQDIMIDGTEFLYETLEKSIRLEQSTIYYVRAYACNKNGNTVQYGYSDVATIETGTLQIVPGEDDNPYPGTEGGQGAGEDDNPYPGTGAKARVPRKK